MSLSGLLRLCTAEWRLVNLFWVEMKFDRLFFNIGVMFVYCRRQETQRKASSRKTSPRLGFEMDSTRQGIVCCTTDLISWVFSYMQFISRYYSFLQVWNVLRCSDSELILQLVISLDIWHSTLKSASIHCKASRNEDNKIMKNETSDSKDSS